MFAEDGAIAKTASLRPLASTSEKTPALHLKYYKTIRCGLRIKDIRHEPERICKIFKRRLLNTRKKKNSYFFQNEIYSLIGAIFSLIFKVS